jgi:tRNA (mo5U34)-methyltransferase
LIANVADLRHEVDRIQWWHTIDLGNGIVTRGRVDNLATLKRIGLPERLDGKTVLDIGAWDGFYSFEAERRGAARVLATDSFSWGGGGWGTKAGFELARKALGSKVEDLHLDVMDLSPDRIGTFDLVLCLGILYHMRHPLLALERVFSVTGDHLILETHVDLQWIRRPAIAFYPNDELQRDATNWCGPNPAAVEAMLRTVGFRRVQRISTSPSRFHRLAYAPLDARKTGARLLAQAQHSRMVFHAWR